MNGVSKGASKPEMEGTIAFLHLLTIGYFASVLENQPFIANKISKSHLLKVGFRKLALLPFLNGLGKHEDQFLIKLTKALILFDFQGVMSNS